MNARLLLSCLFALCAFAAHGGEVYKWTDAQGRVHYSQSPPDGAPVQVVPVQPSPSPSPAPVPPAPQTRQPRQASGPPAEVAADVPPEPLPGRPGPLPEKQVSEYLSTLATLMNVNASPPLYNFSITVRVRADVPVGAVLVAAFEDPAAAGRFLRTTGRVVMTSDYPQKIKDEILLGSPTFSEVRCRNYAVVIRLYRDEQSSTPMGTHRQLIQSRVDSRLLRANPGSITRLIDAGHVCP